MLHLNLVVSIVASVLVATVTVAHATTYFVRTSGDDTWDGLSPATAFSSIRPAARLLQNPGDRLIVGPGTYHEGNIKPRGSGTVEAPIVLLGDVSGELTGDAPGAVLIVPSNTPDETTGIIVYGRSHIIIEGFDVDGADDAGIQIRPHSRTGADSQHVTIRNNNVRNGRRRGIQVTASGSVIVTGNRATQNGGTGLSIVGGESTHVQPQITNNITEQNRVGLVIKRSIGGTVVGNALRENVRNGIRLDDCDGLSITRNEVDGRVSGYAANLTLTDNKLNDGGRLTLGGIIMLTKNEFTNQFADLTVYSSGSDLEVVDNRLASLTAYGLARAEIRDNDAWRIEVSAEHIAITDNRLSRIIKTYGTNVDVSRNQADYIEARGIQLEMHDNVLVRWADIIAASGNITGNRAERLAIMRFHEYSQPYPIDPGRGPYRIERNITTTALRIGDANEPLAGVVARDNECGTMLRAYGRGILEIRNNDAHGIAGIMAGADSTLTMNNNISRGSIEAGLIAIGAVTARIENNTSSENQDSGLAARGIRNLTVSGNIFQHNPSGGISVLVPLAGDCNSNLDVTVAELVVAVRVALEQRPLHACTAADVSGDAVVTIDELVLAAGTANGNPDRSGGTITLHNNRVEENGRFGVNVATGGTVTATDNRVLRNGGIALAITGRGADGTAVVGNVLGLSGNEGLMLDGVTAARVRNNTVFSNDDTGILLRDAPRAQVINNLIYANKDDGISIGIGIATPAANVTVANNTIYANEFWGIVIGTHTRASSDTIIMDNIIDDNLRGGVAAEPVSGSTVAGDFNLNNDVNYETIPEKPNNFEGDPLYVAAAGTDGILGGEGFADDNLRLQANTPARDAGSAPAAELGITGSAIEGLEQDTGVVDIGFHYGASAAIQGAR